MPSNDAIEPSANAATANAAIDSQTIEKQQRIHEQELLDEEYTIDRQRSKIKEIEEYKSGKILYEEVLTGMLQQANTAYQRNQHTTFCRTIQSIWNNCYKADRQEIYKEVKKAAKEQIALRYKRALKQEMITLTKTDAKFAHSRYRDEIKADIAEIEQKYKDEKPERLYPKERILSIETFDTLVRSNLSNMMEKGLLLQQNWYGTEWRLSYQIIQETLRKRYHGTVKQFIQDKLEG